MQERAESGEGPLGAHCCFCGKIYDNCSFQEQFRGGIRVFAAAFNVWVVPGKRNTYAENNETVDDRVLRPKLWPCLVSRFRSPDFFRAGEKAVESPCIYCRWIGSEFVKAALRGKKDAFSMGTRDVDGKHAEKLPTVIEMYFFSQKIARFIPFTFSDRQMGPVRNLGWICRHRKGVCVRSWWICSLSVYYMDFVRAFFWALQSAPCAKKVVRWKDSHKIDSFVKNDLASP